VADQAQGADLLSEKVLFLHITIQSQTTFLSAAVSLFTVRLNPYPRWFSLIRTNCQHWGQEWVSPPWPVGRVFMWEGLIHLSWKQWA